MYGGIVGEMQLSLVSKGISIYKKDNVFKAPAFMGLLSRIRSITLHVFQALVKALVIQRIEKILMGRKGDIKVVCKLYVYVCVGVYRVWWVNYRHLKLLFSRMNFVWFRLCSKTELFEHCLWGMQHHDPIHYFRNLETACCTARKSYRKFQYEDFTVFGCQAEDSKTAGWV